MGKIRDRWYKIVARDLWYNWLDALDDLKGLQMLQRHISTLEQTVLNLEKERDSFAQQASTNDAQLAMQIMREKAGIDFSLPGKIAMLREQLHQELAVNEYYEDLLHMFTDGDYTKFNGLSLDERKGYFAEVDKKVNP